MYLEGCRWDSTKHMLGDSIPKVLYTELPLIHFIPVANKKGIPADKYY